MIQLHHSTYSILKSDILFLKEKCYKNEIMVSKFNLFITLLQEIYVMADIHTKPLQDNDYSIHLDDKVPK